MIVVASINQPNSFH